jgi:hypothetical protein
MEALLTVVTYTFAGTKEGVMSDGNLIKAVGAALAAAILGVGLWLVLTGKLGFMKAIEERAERERTQQRIQEQQRQQNLRRPFEALSFP